MRGLEELHISFENRNVLHLFYAQCRLPDACEDLKFEHEELTSELEHFVLYGPPYNVRQVQDDQKKDL